MNNYTIGIICQAEKETDKDKIVNALESIGHKVVFVQASKCRLYINKEMIKNG